MIKRSEIACQTSAQKGITKYVKLIIFWFYFSMIFAVFETCRKTRCKTHKNHTNLICLFGNFNNYYSFYFIIYFVSSPINLAACSLAPSKPALEWFEGGNRTVNLLGICQFLIYYVRKRFCRKAEGVKWAQR